MVAVTRNVWIVLVCLAVAGAGDAISGVFRMAIWNQTISSALADHRIGVVHWIGLGGLDSRRDHDPACLTRTSIPLTVDHRGLLRSRMNDHRIGLTPPPGIVGKHPTRRGALTPSVVNS